MMDDPAINPSIWSLNSMSTTKAEMLIASLELYVKLNEEVVSAHVEGGSFERLDDKILTIEAVGMSISVQCKFWKNDYLPEKISSAFGELLKVLGLSTDVGSLNSQDPYSGLRDDLCRLKGLNVDDVDAWNVYGYPDSFDFM